MGKTGQPVEIVVLGGGYVGLWSTRRIARGLRRELAAGLRGSP